MKRTSVAGSRGTRLLGVVGPALVLALAGCREDAGRPAAARPGFVPARGQITATAGTPARDPACCPPPPAPTPAAAAMGRSRPISIPDVALLDQDGREVRFYSDLVRGKVVAINFVFTSCRASCPLLGAGFAKLQERLGDRLGRDCSLISVSVDPAVDRPERLKEWARTYGARPGWTLVTAPEGAKPDLDRLLKALQVFSPEKTDHTQAVLVVDGSSLEGRSSRRLAAADELAAMMDEALRSRGGRNYFTDAPLVDQDGRRFRFYSDLLRGKVVVINAFFTSCTGACPVMSDALARLQDELSDRLGKDLVLISLTVDPATDGREQLASYAKHYGARPGWHFLTGSREDLAPVLRKLGQPAEGREAHTSIIIVGNEATGLWMKHRDPADAAGLLAKVQEALADGHEATGAGR
jgi:protein SCO1